VTLLLPTFSLGPASAATPNVQPLLLELAAQQPATRVGVIVQKLVRDDSVEHLAIRLGGVVTKNLHIINAFAAELPAGAVPALAQAPGVRWVSLDAPMVKAGRACSQCIDTSGLLDAYVQTIGATRVWNEAPYLQGQGITVAVVDSGIANHDDLKVTTSQNSAFRVQAWAKFNSFTSSANDAYGHGTHVAGIIGGNGAKSRGARIGVAPKVNLVNIKVSDDRGAGIASDVVSGLQWVYDHKAQYNIRVVNLSLNSSVAESYHTNPLNAAVEILWFNGIVVVVSAGNNGGGSNNGILYPPANDPFVITVGATDDRGTAATQDDVLASFSAYGTTADGFAKPDLVAPGTNIISLLAGNSCELARGHADHRVDGFAGGRDYYFRMSGTSMASAVTAGAVALLLQDEPGLTPDQVKYRLKATARPLNHGIGVGAGYLDIYAAVHGTTTQSANTGLTASQLLWTGSEPVAWNSVNWNSVNWGSVNWNSVNWNSVNWNSVNWNSVHWGN
jgi:serine protease AprX